MFAKDLPCPFGRWASIRTNSFFSGPRSPLRHSVFLVILSSLLPFTSNLPFTPNFSCFLAVDILLFITALAGNFLIFVALHKESSLHPPSKLLHQCLATTDLFNAFLINKKNHSYSVLKNWMSGWFVYQQFSRPKRKQ